MTTAHRDRLLEYALGQVLREEPGADRAPHSDAPPPVDLAAEILAAWERGERASTSIEELTLAAPTRGPRLAAEAPARGPTWRMAAGLLAACGIGVALWQLSSSPGAGDAIEVAEAPFAEASRPLLSLTDPTALAATALEPGARISVEGPEPVAVQLAGGRLEFSPGAIFALDAAGDGLIMEFGEVRASGFAAPFALDFGFAQARLQPGAALLMRVAADALRFVDQPAEARATLLDEGALGRSVELDVRAGRVELVRGKASWMLAEPDSSLMFVPGAQEPSPALLDREWIYERFMQIADREGWGYAPTKSAFPGRNLADERASASSQELREFLESTPHAWPLLSGILIEAALEPQAGRLSLLSFLARTGSPRSLRLARSLLARVPEDFSEDQLIALAEAGDTVFENEVRARVLVRLEDPLLELDTARCAAFLAREGEDTGRPILHAVLEAPAEGTSSIVDGYLAARGLEALGEDGPWRSFADRWARRALVDLKNGDEQSARYQASILALHGEPARSLPTWTAFELWNAAGDEREPSLAGLRAALEAHLTR